MKKEVFNKMLSKLNTIDDIERVKKEFGLSEEVLLSILSHKIARDATRRFYQVKHRAKYLLKDWLRGESLIHIACRFNFPPVLMAKIILEEHGISRVKCNKYLRNPNCVNNPRLTKELRQALERDITYSPNANTMQAKYGRMVEDAVKDWLDTNKIEYRQEKEIKEKYPKTPDFLLKKPLKIDDDDIHWIECKASFGDDVEMRRNYRRQLLPYKGLFGNGMVVYWYGYIEDAPHDKDILIATQEFFTSCA
jgi:hypothetical protein